VATRKNPKLPQPYFNLGNLAESKKDRGEAVKCYEDAIAADSAFAGAYSALAIIYAGAGQYAQAESLLTTGLTHLPDHAIMQANLGSVYLRLNRPRDAIEPLERALHWTPHGIAIRLNLAIAYLRLQRLEDGRKQLDEVLLRDPANETAKRLIEELETKGGNL
jgi:tetratricopeptide (TPR) repeat protein